MRNPKDFFQPLALGAPDPLREIPFTPSRMIHFFDPSNAKMAAKVPDMATQAMSCWATWKTPFPPTKKLRRGRG
jgi:hypothetical protein